MIAYFVIGFMKEGDSMFTKNEFFYCYSSKLFKFLTKDKGFYYICSGVHDQTKVRFFQFKRTDLLLTALSEYKARRS
jgi:hypothetical protein